VRFDDVLGTHGWPNPLAPYARWLSDSNLMLDSPDKGLPMLINHAKKLQVGRWVRLMRDAKGLWGEGLVTAAIGKEAIIDGMRGLSVGACQNFRKPIEGVTNIDGASLEEGSLTNEPRNPNCFIAGIRLPGTTEWIGTPARGDSVPVIWRDAAYQRVVLGAGKGGSFGSPVLPPWSTVVSPDTLGAREFFHRIIEKGIM
jgi:hypothetical protein